MCAKRTTTETTDEKIKKAKDNNFKLILNVWFILDINIFTLEKLNFSHFEK